MCRSALTPYINNEGNPQYYGRFNQGVVTINLPYIAYQSVENEEDFWKLMEKYTKACYQALMIRHNRLHDIQASVAPILWQHGALARLNADDKITDLLHGGYSTISLGFAGLYECVKAITGESHTSPTGKKFALEVMNYLNDKCKEWKARENVDFSLYGTPLESTTYKFAQALQRDFPNADGVHDYSFVTNSYHIHVTEQVDPFTKLKFESEFQALSPGGAISYVETSNLQNNIPAVKSMIKYIYDNILYAELNTKSDYCQECQYDGEIFSHLKNNDYVWQCPNCGNEDYNKMNIARRVCGYIGTNKSNFGRNDEYANRFVHTSISEDENIANQRSDEVAKGIITRDV